jgi:hypothetical protein
VWRLLLPSSGQKNGTCCLHLYPEDEGSKFLRNVGKALPDYTTSHPRTEYSSAYHLYIPIYKTITLHFKNSTFIEVFMMLRTSSNYLPYNINEMVFVTEKKCSFWEVEAEFLYIIYLNLVL